MSEAKWIKNDRTYKLEDSNGNVLLTIEDRTCSGNYVTKEMLEQYSVEYFKDLEKEND
ncbi:hypothetical protein [Lederbergia citri]|uniref:Uncharacterized protein n=1 Tax=Lederbergia citri TaxID=2833580 RepID=A0A942TCN9_9BACI|nr:hypothetical protein [Lederbergia citri]MBS4194356.1 hypothetical protein [Lederbergia citri]